MRARWLSGGCCVGHSIGVLVLCGGIFSLAAAESARGPTRSELPRLVHPVLGIEADFDASGVRIRATGTPAPWAVRLILSSHGLRGDLSDPFEGWTVDGPGQIRGDYGTFLETFVEAERAMEQVWTLPSPIRGRGGADEPLVLEYEVRGGLPIRLSGDGHGFVLLFAMEPVLQWTVVSALDAAGLELPYHLELLPGESGTVGGFRIILDLSEAIYPVTLSSRFTTPAGERRDLQETALQSKAYAEEGEGAPGLFAAPANDLCSGAEVIPASGPFPHLTAVADVLEATTTGDPTTGPSCANNRGYRSLWYVFTPATTGWYAFTTCDEVTSTTLEDTVLTVFTSAGGCAGAFTELPGQDCLDGCDNDRCGSTLKQSRVATELSAGTTYYVLSYARVGSLPAPGKSSVQLQVSRPFVPAPGNDTCSGAEVIHDGPYPVTTTIIPDVRGATCGGDPAALPGGDPSCAASAQRGLWYTFTPSASGYYMISSCSDAPSQTTVDDTVLALYTSASGCLGPFTEVLSEPCLQGCDDNSCASEALQATISSYLEAGSSYYVLLYEGSGSEPAAGNTAVQLRITASPMPPAPANDDCTSARVIPGSGPFPYTTALTADIRGASCTGDPGATACSPRAAARSTWYTFTPTSGGAYTFSTCADAPTGTTVDDTVMEIYASSGGCAGPFTSVACDGDSCGVEALQSTVRNVYLDPGRTYYVVVWQQGTTPLDPGNASVQLRVSAATAPPSDTCGGAAPLSPDLPLDGTTLGANDDYRLSGGSCFTGFGQTASTAPGREVAYSFTAPGAGSYSFRATGYASSGNLVLYVSATCESGTPPVTVGSCLAASNRSASSSSEEILCVPLAAGQTVYVYVDDNTLNAGSGFRIEVNRCEREVEGNDTPATANPFRCGIEGSSSPEGEADFFDLGAPSAGSRVYALADGVAGNSTNFDLHVTTDTDTLEWDNSNNDIPWGASAPNVAGTLTDGTRTLLRVSHGTQGEPYRLYAVSWPSNSTVPEVEPNDTIATANALEHAEGELAGPPPSTDADLYRFQAVAGDLVFLSVDGDPDHDGVQLNPRVELLDQAGSVLATANDSAASGNTRAPVPGNLSSLAPFAVGEALTYRAAYTGAYFARVSAGSDLGTPSEAGPYVLSISLNCLNRDADGDGVPNVSDCAELDPTAFNPPGPVSDLRVDRGAAAGDLRVSWQSQDGTAGVGTDYDVVQGVLSALRSGGYPGGGVCAGNDLPEGPYAELDGVCPAGAGNGCWYLVRAQNVCATGSYVDASQTAPHPLDGTSVCP